MTRKRASNKQPAPPHPEKPAVEAPPDIKGAAPMPPSQEEVRLHAYLLWEAAGKPLGNGEAFWLQAERELYSR
jgi:hypothetical protein